MWHVAERVWRGGREWGRRGNRTWPGWCVECQMRLWFVACPLPNKSNAINSLSRSNRAYQARGIPPPFRSSLLYTARGCCCCCPLCQILDTCPGDTWTTSMKIQFPVENALTNQLFCVYSKYSGFQQREHWYPVSRLNLPGISYQLCTIFLYFSSPFYLLFCCSTGKLSALSLYMYCKCIWDCPSRCWCWFWLLCLGCFSFSLSSVPSLSSPLSLVSLGGSPLNFHCFVLFCFELHI